MREDVGLFSRSQRHSRFLQDGEFELQCARFPASPEVAFVAGGFPGVELLDVSFAKRGIHRMIPNGELATAGISVAPCRVLL